MKRVSSLALFFIFTALLVYTGISFLVAAGRLRVVRRVNLDTNN
jgi:hypothetical protein